MCIRDRDFAAYRKVREVLAAHVGRTNRRAAELASRFRRPRELAVGQRVLVRDPKMNKEISGRR
eukprot:11893668-Alexandrium_andersonii.AAC.1